MHGPRLRLAAPSLFALAALAAPCLAQRRAEMTMVIPFLAEQRLTPEYLEPRGWLDDTHYLGFVAAPADQTRFVKVDARTGVTADLYAGGADRKAFGELPGLRAASLDAVLGSPGNYIWNADHSAYLIQHGGDLLWYDLADDAARRLTSDPAEEIGVQISPDGRMVGYVRDYNLWVVDTEAAAAPRPLTDGGHEDLFFGRLDWVYQEEVFGRGNWQGFWWSPDSSRIALFRLDESPVREFTLVSDTPTEPTVEVVNYPKAGSPNPTVDLGVVDVFGGGIEWFDLSRYGTADILIVHVEWHPSGEEVFFQVTDREQTWMEMLAGSVETGDVRLVFREESDCWFEPSAAPHWIADGAEFLWQSERSGREHLYRYDRSGKLLGQVTEGAFDVEEIAGVDEEAGLVYFGTDRTGPTEFHLWRVGLDGSNAAPITERTGWHNVDVSPGAKLFIDEFSAIDYRLGVSVHTIDGEKLRDVVESDMNVLAPFGLRPPEWHQVQTRDGFTMEGMLIKPADFEAGKKYPVLCHIYAGPHAPRVLNRWRFRDYLWHQLIAQKGYLVWICDNRSASGKGRESAKACWRDMGSSELRDLEDGVSWLVDQGVADPERIGIWGWSYGGYQTLFNLTHSKVWSMGIAVNPVTDWRFYDTIYTERYMGLPQTNPDGYRRASVLEAAGALDGDLLLVHATMDDNVHMQNSMQFLHAAQSAGKQLRFMAYPRVRHGVEDIRQQLHLFQMMTDFVVEKL